MTFDTTVDFDMIVAYVIPMVDLLTSTLVTWGEEHIQNFSVQQRVHISNIGFFLCAGPYYWACYVYMSSKIEVLKQENQQNPLEKNKFMKQFIKICATSRLVWNNILDLIWKQ
jgi:hypothetical protein